MQVILLERVEKLGQMGDEVKVKNGYARNYLLPQKKALRATPENRARFETERVQLEARNLEQRKEAESVGAKLDGKSFVVIRQAGESGQLYGSVTPRDIAELVSEGGVSIKRGQVRMSRPIKTIGIEELEIVLHPEVAVPISLNVARSPEEAERQARGEILIGVDQEADEAAEALANAEEVFESEDLAKEAESRAHEGDEAKSDDANADPSAS